MFGVGATMRAHYGTLNFGQFFQNWHFFPNENAKSQRVRQEGDQLQKFFQKFAIFQLGNIRAKYHPLTPNSLGDQGGIDS